MIHFEELQGRVLRERVRKAIREAIFKGELKPGQRLSEQELGDQLGVSRLPVREAIRQLEEQGLVVSYPHRGSYICELTREDARDLTFIRLGLEQTALKLILEIGVLDNLIASLKAVVKKMSQLVEDNPPLERAGFELDVEFHSTIIRTTDSPPLLRAWSGVDCLMAWMSWIPSDSPNPHHASILADHAGLLEVFQKRNLEQTLRAIESHITSANLASLCHFPPRKEQMLSRLRERKPGMAAHVQAESGIAPG